MEEFWKARYLTLARGLRSICLVMIVFVSKPTYADSSQDWIVLEADGRAIVWSIGQEKVGFEQPDHISISNRQGGDIEFGFAHSGYTEQDPDGKNAILTITIRRVDLPLTKNELQSLEKKGVSFDHNGEIFDLQEFELDVSLPSDIMEEDRIRKALHLPKTFEVVGQDLPIQIRWKDVPGERLHSWLVGPNGLSINLRGAKQLVKPIGWVWEVDKLAIKAWWDKHVPTGDTLTWSGGGLAFAASMFDSGAIKLKNVDPLNTELTQAYLFELSKLVEEASQPIGVGLLQINSEKFFEIPWEMEGSTKGTSSLASISSISPGLTAKKRPDLVKDLSGDGDGIDALLEDLN